MHWIVDKIPDQSILNTAGWRYIVPQLYKRYPDDDMNLNISVSSPPIIKVSKDVIGAIINLDVTIDVVDGGEVIPVACISLVHLIENLSVETVNFYALRFPYTSLNYFFTF